MKPIAIIILLTINLNIFYSQKNLPEAKIYQNTYGFLIGSCNRVSQEQPSTLFKQMNQEDANVFVWIGDAAYTDKRILPGYWVPNEEKNVVEKFQEAFDDPYYAEYRQNHKIIGVYDDHDINQNDSDYQNPTKEFARQAYLDFLEEPQDSPRRTNLDGIYESYYLGDPRAKLILLDVRYNRNLSTQDTLGENQWKWLEDELNDPSPLVFFIASGVQILPDDRISENFLLKSKERLLKMIKDSGKSVILISGDIHIAEFMEQPYSRQYLGYPLTEVTSSGINMNFYNSEIWIFIQELFEGILPNTYSSPENRKKGNNYLRVTINWARSGGDIFYDSIITLESISQYNIKYPQMTKTIRLSDLQASDDHKFEDLIFDGSLLDSPRVRFWKRIWSHYQDGNIILWVFTVLISLNGLLFFYAFVSFIQVLAYKRQQRKIQQKSKKD